MMNWIRKVCLGDMQRLRDEIIGMLDEHRKLNAEILSCIDLARKEIKIADIHYLTGIFLMCNRKIK